MSVPIYSNWGKITRDALARTRQRFCSVCRSIFEDERPHPTIWDRGTDCTHHATASGCQQAARSGCPVCVIVWRHVTKTGHDDPFALKPAVIFSRWHIWTTDNTGDSYKHFPAGTVLFTISIANASCARKFRESYATRNDSIDFVASGKYLLKRK